MEENFDRLQFGESEGKAYYVLDGEVIFFDGAQKGVSAMAREQAWRAFHSEIRYKRQAQGAFEIKINTPENASLPKDGATRPKPDFSGLSAAAREVRQRAAGEPQGQLNLFG